MAILGAPGLGQSRSQRGRPDGTYKISLIGKRLLVRQCLTGGRQQEEVEITGHFVPGDASCLRHDEVVRCTVRILLQQNRRTMILQQRADGPSRYR